MKSTCLKSHVLSGGAERGGEVTVRPLESLGEVGSDNETESFVTCLS